MACEMEKLRYKEANAAYQIAKKNKAAKYKAYGREAKLYSDIVKRSGVKRIIVTGRIRTFKNAWSAAINAEKVAMRALKKADDARQIYRKCLRKNKRLSGSK